MDNTFIGADNQTYILSPLTLGDNKRFVKWVKYRRWEQFQELKDQLPAEEYSRESNRILQECNNKDLHESSPEVEELQLTVEGVAYLIYLSVRHTQPTITIDRIEEALTGNNARDVYQRLLVLSGIVAKKNDVPSAEQKNSSETPAEVAGSSNPESVAE